MTKANKKLEIAEYKQTENFMCIQRDLGIVLSGVNNLQKALALVLGAVICLEEPDAPETNFFSASTLPVFRSIIRIPRPRVAVAS